MLNLTISFDFKYLSPRNKHWPMRTAVNGSFMADEFWGYQPVFVAQILI
jgi:hypothetical protein